jgi:hypothetical protein
MRESEARRQGAMKGDIDSVNHVGLALRSLDAATKRYEAMGFLLTPLSVHSGSSKPGGPVELMATGNRCAVFPHNYTELLGIVNPGRPDWFFGEFIKKFEGAHIICFGCGDAAVVNERVSSAGIGTSGVIALQRDVGTPEGTRTAKFDCVHFSKAEMPEGLIQAAHHRTPEYIHQARYLSHPNKVVALSNVVLAVADPDAYEAKYAKLTGRQARREGRKRVFALPLVSRVTIVAHDEVRDELPGSLFPLAPAIAGIGYATTDMAGMAARLDDQGIPYVRHDGRLVVPAEAACGVATVFEPA